jgi:hypothetical protein
MVLGSQALEKVLSTSLPGRCRQTPASQSKKKQTQKYDLQVIVVDNLKEDWIKVLEAEVSLDEKEG